jgi:hypothetical protein
MDNDRSPDMVMDIRKKNINGEKRIRAYNERANEEKRQKTPLEYLVFKEARYKKQVPDRAKHMEMEEKVKKPKLDRVQGGDRNFFPAPLIVKGSMPLQDVSAKTTEVSLTGGGKEKMKRRAEKVKQIMKEKNMSMTQASNYVKKNNVKY